MSLAAFSGLWNLSDAPVDAALLERSRFRSPHWDPDHEGVEISGAAGCTATERHLVKEDARDPQPLHADDGCLIVADSYLLYREELARDLGEPPGRSDAALILAAWRKWGEDCARRLQGDFSFVICDPRARRAFAAVDRIARHTVFYIHEPGRVFAWANTIEALRALHPSGFTLNDEVLAAFTLDAPSLTETCYREIRKVEAAHTLAVDAGGVRTKRYWRFREKREPLPCRTREEFYATFRSLFSAAVRECLRGEHPVLAHVSGGLDSSSVAAEAARACAGQGRRLRGFTAIPRWLEGQGNGKAWRRHEMPLVQDLLDLYPNIDSFVFRTDTEADTLLDLEVFHPLTDLPFRNISNLHWVIGALEHIRGLGGRIVLQGGGGNGTISWEGWGPRRRARALLDSVKTWLRPHTLYGGYFRRHDAKFLRTPLARRALRRVGATADMQGYLVERRIGSGLFSSIRGIMLWHGVTQLDPTNDPKLTDFCAGVPQWVFGRGPGILDQRLLVREGMAGIVPDSILQNRFRGAQAADWHLQYNAHRGQWRRQLETLGPVSAKRLWTWYDRKAVFALFDAFDGIETPSREADHAVGTGLLRCLGTAFYLEYLERKGA